MHMYTHSALCFCHSFLAGKRIRLASMKWNVHSMCGSWRWPRGGSGMLCMISRRSPGEGIPRYYDAGHEGVRAAVGRRPGLTCPCSPTRPTCTVSSLPVPWLHREDPHHLQCRSTSLLQTEGSKFWVRLVQGVFILATQLSRSSQLKVTSQQSARLALLVTVFSCVQVASQVPHAQSNIHTRSGFRSNPSPQSETNFCPARTARNPQD